MKSDIKQDKAMAKKAVGIHEKQLHGGKKSDMSKLKKGGNVKELPSAKSMGSLGMKCGGTVKKMAKGGGCEVKGKTKGKMV